MKKHLLVFLSATAFVNLNAQISVTQADIASPGTTIYRGIDTAYTENPIGPSGSNMNWDFSGLLDDRGDTVYFVDPATLPNYASFPSSNLGIIITGQGTAYAVKNSSSLEIIGQEAFVQGQNIAASVNPSERILPFPSTFITNWNNTSVAASPAIPIPGVAGIDSGRVTITKTKNVIVDAWGTLLTPISTTPFNVIRQKESISTDQNLEVHTTGPLPPAGWYPYQNTTTTSTSFLYWANGIGFPIMQADSADAGNVDITWLIQTEVGLKEAMAQKDLRVFPNPANDNVYIMLDENKGVTINVYDIQGKQVLSTKANGAVAQVNIISLEKGMYVYTVETEEGTAVGKGKFVISR